MGSGLTAEAQTYVYPALGRHHASRVALGVMTLTAKDSDSAPQYFAGWRPIARALGLRGSDASCKSRVSHVLEPLAALGVIVADERQGRRRTKVWRLERDHWPTIATGRDPPRRPPPSPRSTNHETSEERNP